jgi:hypothetical protein
VGFLNYLVKIKTVCKAFCITHMSESNPDIRDQVAADRGSIKKLETLIPGLKTYRRLDDIRVADDLLRNQVADRLNRAKANLESLRKQLVMAGDFNGVSSVGSLIFELQRLSGQVRYAEHGYSGIAATFVFNEDKLNKLYDYDYAFVKSAFDLESATSSSTLVYDASQPASLQSKLDTIESLISDFGSKWSARIEYVENILLK